MKQSFQIPENCKTVTVEQDGNKIVCTFEEKFEPKDGCFYKRPIDGLIMILDGKKIDGENYSYHAYFDARIGKELCLTVGCGLSPHTAYLLATESEKQTLLDALAKDGKRWDAENKRVVKLRWRAEKYLPYYTVRTIMAGVAEVLCCNESFQLFDTERYNICNYYQAKEQAQAAADRINAIFAENL